MQDFSLNSLKPGYVYCVPQLLNIHIYTKIGLIQDDPRDPVSHSIQVDQEVQVDLEQQLCLTPESKDL